jgi:hypothetical protein
MITQEIYAHVLPAVKLIIQDLNGAPDAPTLEERIHARLWTYVTHAVRELNPSALATEAPKRDGRSKSWQYVVRFWNISPISNDLVAETDTEIMQGTGSLSAIIAQYAQEMHDGMLPAELSEDAIKEKLPQLRNNLGRQGSAVLRIEYNIGDESYLCQVDVAKPGT